MRALNLRYGTVSGLCRRCNDTSMGEHMHKQQWRCTAKIARRSTVEAGQDAKPPSRNLAARSGFTWAYNMSLLITSFKLMAHDFFFWDDRDVGFSVVYLFYVLIDVLLSLNATPWVSPHNFLAPTLLFVFPMIFQNYHSFFPWTSFKETSQRGGKNLPANQAKKKKKKKKPVLHLACVITSLSRVQSCGKALLRGH